MKNSRWKTTQDTQNSDNYGPRSKTKEQPAWQSQHCQNENANQPPRKHPTSPRGPERKDPLCASIFPWRRNRGPANLTIDSDITQENKKKNRRCGTTTYLNAMASRDENWFIKDSCGGSRPNSWRWSRELFRDLRRGQKNAWVRRGEMFELSHTKAVFRMKYSCTLYTTGYAL